MSNFTPRTTAPSQTDLKWINRSYGGYNRCIVINQTTGYVMPNCTGYTHGRVMEFTRQNSCTLSAGDAGTWYGYTADGYTRGQSPRLGAVICFSGGSYGGHVAVVEKIVDSSHIVTSNSAYGSTNFWTETVTLTNGIWTRPYSGYSCQGFIYIPLPDTPATDIPIWLLFKFNRRKR